ncbi:MAG: PAS domain S-box protein [Desulfamplus sp.]|nr:PAS domain S-box protein [Desulfamplus sp.]
MQETKAAENLKAKIDSILQNNIQNTLDSISKQIAVIDSTAEIILVNRAWRDFADENGLCAGNYCVGMNYIDICKKASKERQNFIEQKQKNIDQQFDKDDCGSITDECKDRLAWDIAKTNTVIEQTEGAKESLDGLKKMLSGELNYFSIDYPCHSPSEKFWFKMSLIRFCFQDNMWIMVSHENITQSKLIELNLIKSENKLKAIIQSVPDAMCMIDRSQNVVWANDVAKNLYGASLVGTKCYRSYGRWNNICHNCIVHKTFRDGKIYSEEYSHLDIEGNERFILSTSSVAGCDEFGNVTHVMEIMRDVTKRRLDEKFLKFMQVAVDTTADGVYWINPDGSIKYVNKAVLKYTGYTETEFTRLRIEDIDPNVSKELWPDVWNELRRVKTMRFETTHRTKDGVDIPFEVTANHVIFDRGDEYNFAVVRNISERKQAEREIRRLSQALEYSPVSVVITDIAGNIKYVNRKFSQVTGYSSSQAIGQNPRILNAGYRAKSYYANLWKTILSGKEWKGEFVNKKKGGEIYWESASISPVFDDNGKIAYFVAIKEDTTARKMIMDELRAAKKKAEAATRAKSDFLATMSHEIRTPMNAIMGMSHLLMDTELNDIQHGYLSNVQSAAQSLLEIINDILDLSKIEAGKMEFESLQFEWNQIVEKIFNVLKFTANEKKLELVYSFGENIPKFMVGDPTRLSQVIMNLVGNAVKYTPSGEVLVHTQLVSDGELAELQLKSQYDDETIIQTEESKDIKSLENSDKDNDGANNKKRITLRVSVKDSGIGISESKLPSLFTPFTQADSSTARMYGGTGLGLVIAKRIVNKMGGDIEVQSFPGKGSTFSFTVVLHEAEHQNSNMDTNLFAGLNVMVVEPNTKARMALSTSLKSLNMRVMAASNGTEAIELIDLAKEPKDIVMINANLSANSINCIDTIKGIEYIMGTLPNSVATKYIVMHDFTATKEARAIAEQVRVDELLAKPITPILLIRTLLNVINTREYIGIEDRKDEDRAEKSASSNNGSYEYQFKDKHILVVDDDEINRQIVVAMVKKAGIEKISLATNGEEALKKAKEEPFDLILMDVEMPIMGGLEATRKIREIGISVAGGKLKDVPIIALTGHALDEYREKCFKAGMNAHIDKPIQPEKLFDALQKWLILK